MSFGRECGLALPFSLGNQEGPGRVNANTLLQAKLQFLYQIQGTVDAFPAV